jgi:hypothetical protein
MSARAASSALVLFLLVNAALVPSAHAGPWQPEPGEYYSVVRGGLFSADTYHDGDGGRLLLGGKWEERSGLWYTELGWKKRLSVALAVPYTSVTLQRNADPFYSATNTGLADLTLGARLALKQQGATALALELAWSAPLGYRQGQYTPLDGLSAARDSGNWAPLNSARRYSRLGDGRQALSLAILYGSALGRRGFLQLSGGAEYRYLTVAQAKPGSVLMTVTGARVDDPLQASSYFGTVSADLGFWVSRSLLLGGRYRGKTLVSTNGDEEVELERELHLAGPFLLWRVDDQLDLMAGSWSTARARNALHYDQYYVALAFKQTKLNRLQGFLGGTKAP